MKLRSIGSVLFWSLSSTTIFAETLGGFANNFSDALGMLGSVFNAASFIVGLFLIVSSISRFFRWRKNPIESPLSTVIIWFVLGLCLVAIPLLHKLAVKAAVATGQGYAISH